MSLLQPKTEPSSTSFEFGFFAEQLARTGKHSLCSLLNLSRACGFMQSTHYYAVARLLQQNIRLTSAEQLKLVLQWVDQEYEKWYFSRYDSRNAQLAKNVASSLIAPARKLLDEDLRTWIQNTYATSQQGIAGPGRGFANALAGGTWDWPDVRL